MYELAGAGEIPHRRITGKLLFPSAEILAWIEGGRDAAVATRPPVIAGSHDPLLDWAARESGSGLATLLNGSLDGLDWFADGRAAIAGLHVPEPRGWNEQTVVGRGLRNCVLIAWAVRSRGLILAQGLDTEVKRITDLRGKRVVLRQPGAGTAEIFSRLLADAGLGMDDVDAAEGLARTESDAAAAVATGEADAALGVEAMARQFHLPFLPLLDEHFDLLIDRRAYFTEPVQTLLAFAHGEAVRTKASSMGGYDVSDLGTVRWLSP